jgi:hypothetical protein
LQYRYVVDHHNFAARETTVNAQILTDFIGRAISWFFVKQFFLFKFACDQILNQQRYLLEFEPFQIVSPILQNSNSVFLDPVAKFRQRENILRTVCEHHRDISPEDLE